MFAELAVTGQFYVRYADIRDSDKAYSTIKAHRNEWDVQYISPKHFASKFHPETFRFSPLSKYEGQVLVKAEYSGMPQSFDAVATGNLVKEALESYGCIIAFRMGRVKDSVAAYRAEYSNVNTIRNALSHLNGSSFGVSIPPQTGYLQMADSRRCAP